MLCVTVRCGWKLASRNARHNPRRSKRFRMWAQVVGMPLLWSSSKNGPSLTSVRTETSNCERSAGMRRDQSEQQGVGGNGNEEACAEPSELDEGSSGLDVPDRPEDEQQTGHTCSGYRRTGQRGADSPQWEHQDPADL